MIAESRPQEREVLVRIVMQLLVGGGAMTPRASTTGVPPGSISLPHRCALSFAFCASIISRAFFQSVSLHLRNS